MIKLLVWGGSWAASVALVRGPNRGGEVSRGPTFVRTQNLIHTSIPNLIILYPSCLTVCAVVSSEKHRLWSNTNDQQDTATAVLVIVSSCMRWHTLSIALMFTPSTVKSAVESFAVKARCSSINDRQDIISVMSAIDSSSMSMLRHSIALQCTHSPVTVAIEASTRSIRFSSTSALLSTVTATLVSGSLLVYMPMLSTVMPCILFFVTLAIRYLLRSLHSSSTSEPRNIVTVIIRYGHQVAVHFFICSDCFEIFTFKSLLVH